LNVLNVLKGALEIVGKRRETLQPLGTNLEKGDDAEVLKSLGTLRAKRWVTNPSDWIRVST
jgi:hypothetical protein